MTNLSLAELQTVTGGDGRFGAGFLFPPIPGKEPTMCNPSDREKKSRPHGKSVGEINREIVDSVQDPFAMITGFAAGIGPRSPLGKTQMPKY